MYAVGTRDLPHEKEIIVIPSYLLYCFHLQMDIPSGGMGGSKILMRPATLVGRPHKVLASTCLGHRVIPGHPTVIHNC
jgi:hypothetical protein